MSESKKWRTGYRDRRCTINHAHGHGLCDYQLQGFHTDSGFECYVSTEDGKEVVGGDDYGPILSLEDARLIAAAPDYHAEALAMIERHDAESRKCGFEHCGCTDCKPFRPIVAKAEGRDA